MRQGLEIKQQTLAHCCYVVEVKIPGHTRGNKVINYTLKGKIAREQVMGTIIQVMSG